MKNNRIQELLSQIRRLFKDRKREPSESLESLLALAGGEPTNGHPHLRIAEIYQKLGEEKKALSEYLTAAEIFCSLEQYHKGAAIYTKVLKQDPELESVRMQLADTYRKLGFLAQAFAQYHKLYCSYNNAGMIDKALGTLGFMAELDPQKFTLSEQYNSRSSGFEKSKGQELKEKNTGINPDLSLGKDSRPLFDLTAMLETNDPTELGETKSITMEEKYRGEKIFEELNEARDLEKLYLDYNFQMGLVCKEMGIIDEAIKQFRMALEKGQKPMEASKLLNQCLANKRPLEECRSFQEMLPQQSA